MQLGYTFTPDIYAVVGTRTHCVICRWRVRSHRTVTSDTSFVVIAKLIVDSLNLFCQFTALNYVHAICSLQSSINLNNTDTTIYFQRNPFS
jgi:hypothetical protein